MNDEGVFAALRSAYDRSAAERDAGRVAEWKMEARARFLATLQQEKRRSLLEIGGGPGTHARFFQERGLWVLCSDLSWGMVRRARDKGLPACQMNLVYPSLAAASFDAIFALNCLLHVPKPQWPIALAALRRVLRPGGLLFLGVYGGSDFEGTWPDDRHEPRRFFAYFTNETLRAMVAPYFEEVDFRVTPLVGQTGRYVFQQLTLRKGRSLR